MSNKKAPAKVESEVVLKATAALDEEVKQDLEKEDGSLKELIENVTDKADEDNDSFKYIDSVYVGLFGYQRLEQKDGTVYKGKLYDKRRLLKGADGNNFYSPCTVTADGRWFDNCGWPIEPPKKLDIEPEAKPDEDDIEEQKRIAREREQRIIAGLK